MDNGSNKEKRFSNVISGIALVALKKLRVSYMIGVGRETFLQGNILRDPTSLAFLAFTARYRVLYRT
jgi:hypothetical protein